MEKFMKIFILIMAVVMIGVIVFVCIDIVNKSKEGQKKAEEVFATVLNRNFVETTNGD